MKCQNDQTVFFLAVSNETAADKDNESIARPVLKLKSLTISNRTSNDADVKSSSECHQIYGPEIAFARTFMTNTANISDSIKVIFCYISFFRKFWSIAGY